MNIHPANQYALDVHEGKILSCKLLQLAVARYFNDLSRQEAEEFPYYHDEEAAQTVINFLESCHHFEGSMAGKPFLLEPWQQFLIWNVFGWKRCKDDLRRFSTAYVEVPKKNGKSILASGIALYGLSPLDGEARPQVYAIATKEDQAKIVFDGGKEILKKSPTLRNLYDTFAKSIYCPESNGFFKPLGNDSDTQDGINIHFVVVDEYHAHKSDKLYGNAESATASRDQSLMFVITTAGFNTAGPCYRMREAGLNLLNDNLTDDSTFYLIYELDEEDWEKENWKNQALWAKAHPNLNVSVTVDKLQELLNKALAEGSSKLSNWMTKNMNRWLNAYELWKAAKVWKNCDHGPVDLELLKGKQCYAGLDMASNDDLTACVLNFPVQSGIEIAQKLYFFWMPEENVREKMQEHRADYQKWIELGYIRTTPGNIIDKAFILQALIDIMGLYDLQSIHYDPWNLRSDAAVWSDQHGLPLVELNQGLPYMAPPTKEYETQIYGGLFNHGGNPVMKWMIGNCMIYKDPRENITIHKGKSRNKVDGPVADVMSTFGATDHQEEEKVPGFFVIKVKE